MATDPRALYLDLLKRTLTRFDMGDDRYPIRTPIPGVQRAVRAGAAVLRHAHLELNRVRPFDPAVRRGGRDHPYAAETMIGLDRLDNLQECVSTVLEDRIPGDLLEAGVWRGGAAIFMRALLKVDNVRDRLVWVADSFAGVPPPDPNVPADRGDFHHRMDHLAVSLEEVQANFHKYGMLDNQVRFLKGWFADTLATSEIERLAVLRADGDLYESTMDILRPLYPKVSAGGFVIIDDYHALANCRLAVDDYRREQGIREPVLAVPTDPPETGGVYWRKS